MEKQLTPQLRFPEYNGVWEKSKIGDVSRIYGRIGYRGYTVQDIVEKGKGAITLSPSNFINNHIDISKSTYISWDKYEESPEIKIFNRDILFVKTGSTFGKTAFVKNLDEPATINPQIVVLKNITIHNDFLGYVITLPLIRKQVESIVVGGAIPTMSQKELSKMVFNLPSLAEQQKIASFLTDVDNKITKLTKKKDLLEQYKKGIMQKIFSQELRFKDDEGNEFPLWQKNKLGKSVKFLKGKGLPKSEIVCDGQFKCIHYGELFTKYNELIDNIISRTNDNDKTILSKVNDVLMPTSDVTPNGLATASCIKESDVILGGDVLIIRQDVKKIEGVYLAYYIKHFRNDVMKLVSGSTVYHLYGSDMKNLQVLIPCLDEQIKIANFLSDIDVKIEALNTKIENSTAFKKGLLQQMFV
jgi:type I restriction enzyme S subunit